jgi:dolichol kinase
MNALESSGSLDTTAPEWIATHLDALVDDEPVDDREAHAPARPSNPARSIFHIISALVSLSFTLVVFTPTQLPWVAGSIAGTFWILEALRRPYPRFNALLMRFFRPVAHASEAHRVNSATWYMTALTLISLTKSDFLCVVGVAVLGFADPAASFVGRRWGHIVLLRGRTLEGAVGFVLAGTLAASLALMLVVPRPALGFALLVAFAASVTGAVAELLSRRLDDNFTIPLVATATAAAMLAAFGRLPW